MGFHHWVALLAVTLVGCAPSSPEQIRQESAKLRASFEKYRIVYLTGIETWDRLVPETLAWLDGPAANAPRATAISEARVFMERWARVYFAPRYIHEQLRFDKYVTPVVKDAQRRLLDHLKRSYFELHDYQRYAQRAAESTMHGALVGRLPHQLREFQRRLRTSGPYVDEITPMLDSLPR